MDDNKELTERLARVESRLCKLMLFIGIDPQSLAKPQKTLLDHIKDLLKEKKDVA